MMTDKMMTYAEAAERIGMSDSWLRKQKKLKRVPYERYGRSVRFTEAQVQQIIADHHVPVRLKAGPQRRRVN